MKISKGVQDLKKNKIEKVSQNFCISSTKAQLPKTLGHDETPHFEL